VRAVESALAAHPDVSWAAVNAVLGVVVLAYPDEAEIDTVIDIVEEVERAHDLGGAEADPVEHPGAESAVGRAVTALAADGVALSLVGVGWLVRATPIPIELASIVTVLDTQPRARAKVERTLGVERADVAISLANAVGQALAQGSIGLGLDAASRGLQLAEAQARRDAWRRREDELAGSAHRATADTMSPERPPCRQSRRAGGRRLRHDTRPVRQPPQGQRSRTGDTAKGGPGRARGVRHDLGAGAG
jgi:hypothetical protein